MVQILSLTVADAAEMYDSLCDPRIYEFIDDEPPASIAALAERYARLERGVSPDGRQRWLNWVVRDGGRCVGYVQATREGRWAEIAYVVFPAYWRRGYARTAVTAMIALLRAQHGVDTLRASVDLRNVGSRAVLESLGFAHVETRDATIRGEMTTDALYDRRISRAEE